MGQSAKAALGSAACFALPWLFAAWFFWKTYSLPFPWIVVTVLAAALVGYLLYRDRDKCLERFYRKREPEKTSATQSANPDLKLQGLYRLLALYVLLALTWTAGYAVAASYLRSHSRIGPVAWAPFSRFLVGFIDGTPTTAANDLAIAAAGLASAVGFMTYAAGRVYLFPDQGPVLRGRRVGSGKEARRE